MTRRETKCAVKPTLERGGRWITEWGTLVPWQKQKRAGVACSHCSGPLDRNGQRYCKACHAAYMRAWRPKNSELPPEPKKRQYARAYARVYVGRGKIQRLPCERCGDEKSQIHHEDYNKPLLVKWLCRPCHLELHRMEQAADLRRAVERALA